jgi:hypothetical protein
MADAFARQRAKYEAVKAATAAAEESASAKLAARYCVNMSYERQRQLDIAQWVGVDVEGCGRVCLCVNDDTGSAEVARRRQIVHAVQTQMQSATASEATFCQGHFTLRCVAEVESRTAWVSHSVYDSLPAGLSAVIQPVACEWPLPLVHACTLLPCSSCEDDEILLAEQSNSTWVKPGVCVGLYRNALPAVAVIITPSGDTIAEWLEEMPSTEPHVARLQAAIQRASDTSPALNEGDKIWLSDRHWFTAGRLYTSSGQRLLIGTLRSGDVIEVEVVIQSSTEYPDCVYLPGAADIVPTDSFNAMMSVFHTTELPRLQLKAQQSGRALEELCVLAQTVMDPARCSLILPSD